MTEKNHDFLASASVKNCTDRQCAFIYGPPNLLPRENIYVKDDQCSEHLEVRVDTTDFIFKAVYPNIFSVTCNNENCRYNLAKDSLQRQLFSIRA